MLSTSESQNPAITPALWCRYSRLWRKNPQYRPYLPLRRAQKLPCISAIAAMVPQLDNADWVKVWASCLAWGRILPYCLVFLSEFLYFAFYFTVLLWDTSRFVRRKTRLLSIFVININHKHPLSHSFSTKTSSNELENFSHSLSSLPLKFSPIIIIVPFLNHKEP